MSQYEEDDDYYDEEDGGEDDVDYYVSVIRSKLDKGVRIGDEAIIAQLELYDYDTDKALKAIKNQLKPKTTAGGAAGGGGGAKTSNTGGKAGPQTAGSAGNKQPAGKGASNTPVATGTSKPITTAASSASSTSAGETVFQKAQTTSQTGEESQSTATGSSRLPSKTTVADLHLSDDELPAASTKPTAAVTKAEGGHKPELTMVVVGHVDAGKSTLVGHLLQKLGKVSQRTMHKYEKDSAAIGKASFSLAWVMDERQAERERGVTIDIAERSLSTEHRQFTILDAPGHRDFVPNMIKGAAQADVALLVVPATEGEYETCMMDTAQTKEHATLLKALGVNQVIVVINKMDSTKPSVWSAERYYRIEAELRQYLVQDLSFHEKLVRCVPVSGFTGENLLKMSDDCPGKSWYSGITLQQALDTFHIPPKQIDKAFRAVVSNVRSLPRNEYEVQVNVLQGKINPGRSIGLATYSASHCTLHAAVVQSIKSMDGEDGGESTHQSGSASSASLQLLGARERGYLRISSKAGCEPLELTDGHEIICFKGPPFLTPISNFKATITTMTSLEFPIIEGCKFELYLKGVEMQCIVSTLHSMNGSTKKPKCIPAGKSAVVSITVEQMTIVEPFNICRSLGRFALRFKGATIAVGVCE